MEMDGQNNDGYGFHTFPPEMWTFVVKKLDNIYDVENLCLAYKELCPFVAADLAKMKEKYVINLVMQMGFVSAENGLNMRLVCKEWRKTVDEFYSRSHDKKSCLLPSCFPTVTLKVPLDDTRSRKVMDIADNKNCRFVGGRLKLLLSKTKEPTNLCNQIEDEAFQSVCERATHLTIVEEKRYDYNNREIQELCGPFLRQMVNVTSIICDLDLDIVLIQCLHCPEKLLLIKTTNRDARRPESSDNWEPVFQSVKSNLKIFHCKVLTRGMNIAMHHVKFDNLEELGAAEHYWDHDADGERDEYEEDENGSSYVMDLYQAVFKKLVPNLKSIMVPFFGGNYLVASLAPNYVSEFPTILMEVTNNLQTLEQIELVVNPSVDLYSWNYPISRAILGRGSRTVRRLVVKIDVVHDMHKWCNWCFVLARVWPELQSLQIGQRQYGLRGNVWELTAPGLLKCTDCKF